MAIFECIEGRYFAGWLWAEIQMTPGPRADVLGAVYRDGNKGPWNVRLRVHYHASSSTQWGDMVSDPKRVIDILDRDSADAAAALENAAKSLQFIHVTAERSGLLRVLDEARAIPCMTDDPVRVSAALMSQPFARRPQGQAEA